MMMSNYPANIKVVKADEAILDMMRKADLDGSPGDYTAFIQPVEGGHLNKWLVPKAIMAEVSSSGHEGPGNLLKKIMSSNNDYVAANVNGRAMIVHRSLAEECRDGFFADPSEVSARYANSPVVEFDQQKIAAMQGPGLGSKKRK